MYTQGRFLSPHNMSVSVDSPKFQKDFDVFFFWRVAL